MKEMNLSKIALLEQLSENLLNAEAQLRQQHFTLVSTILRELGCVVTISKEHRSASVRMGNMWHEVQELILADDVNYEVYFKDKEGNLYDLEDVEEFETNIFGDVTTYSSWDILYFLQDYMLGVLKGNSVNKEV